MALLAQESRGGIRSICPSSAVGIAASSRDVNDFPRYRIKKKKKKKKKSVTAAQAKRK
jgi:hypothetical protein